MRDRTVDDLRAAGCVFAEDEAALLLGAAESADALAAMVARRVAGDPLEQIVGWAEFRGLRVVVEPGVFVPRQRTGFLAGLAIAAAREGAIVVDMCCGAGAVGMAVLAESGAAEVHAADVDPVAVACAQRNLPRVHMGDLYAALPADLRGRIDVVVANAPYVPTDAVATMPPEARLHEPMIALDGGADGLDVARRVVAGAPEWLLPGGVLLVETSTRQAPALREWFARNGFVATIEADDEIGGTAVQGTFTPGGRPV
ncbi:MAG: methylase [Pseudonocardia sp. SCN 72-86]|nr:MAG: methylase [Pseudonocardia sp. SCN 72-86]